MSDRDPSAAEDLAVVREALGDCESAVEALVERLKCIPRIVAAQNARHGGVLDEHEVADVAQDALVVVWKKLSEFEGRSNLEGWVYRICTLEFMNVLKRKARRSSRYSEAPDAGWEPQGSEGAEPSTWEFDDVHVGLGLLPEEEAVVLHLKHFEGLTLDGVAERLGQPKSSVRTRYYRGLTRMQEFLKGREGTHG